MATLEATRDRLLLCVMCVLSGGKPRITTYASTLGVLSFITAISINLSVSSALILPKPADWSTHSRVQELCVHKQGGHEGRTIKGFQLSQVFIITTPGLRYHHVEQADHASSSPTDCHFESFSRNHPSKKVQFYSEMLDYKATIKEGKQKALSSFKIYSSVPSSRHCQIGALMSVGVSQGIRLGEYFSLAYQELWSLNKYFASARTMGNEVLYQATSAVLYGLLHEKQFVKNHIQKMGKNYAALGVCSSDIQEHSTDQIHHFIQSSFEKEHRIFKDTSLSMNRDKIDQIIGADLPAKNALSHFAVNYCPNSQSQKHINLDDVHGSKPFSISHVLSLSDGHNKYLSQDSLFQSYSKSRTSIFRKFLQVWLQSSMSHHNPEANLVTVDDLFFLSFLTSLNQTVTKHIPPVSRFVLEKFVFNSSTRELNSRGRGHPVTPEHANQNVVDQFYRVLLNGKVVTKELSNCASDPMVSLGLCSSSSVFAALNGLGEVGFERREDL